MPRHTAVVILAAAFAATACGGEKTETDAAPRASGPDAAALAKAVVAVEGVYRGSQTKEATGVVIDAREGLVLTANHAMENAPSINVRLLSDGTLTHARQVVRAQCHDLAMLKLLQPPSGLSQIRLGNSDAVTVGQPAWTITYRRSSNGRPGLEQFAGAVTTVNVSATFPPLPRMRSLIAHQTPLAAQASGSPLVDASGALIGINTFSDHPREPKIDGVEYALASNYIRRRLNELAPGPEGLPVGWRNEHNKCHGPLHRLLAKGHLHVPYSAAGTKKGAKP